MTDELQLDIFVHQPIETNPAPIVIEPPKRKVYVLRDYQREASDAAVNFFNGKLGKGNALIVCPTGSGKSLIVADIASRLDGKLLVFQPSKEILEQNYEKYRSYGFYDCAVWSASMNSKKRARVTFATIGSVMSNPEVFEEYKNIIVDECHLCNARGGRYKKFFEMGNRHILGLTATPYRLVSYSMGCILKFLTRTKPRIFAKLIYQVPIQKLMADGYLAKLRYFDMQLIDVSNVRKNSTGQDYDEESLRKAYIAQDMNKKLVEVVNRLRTPKDGSKRHGILVFTRFIDESEWLVSQLGDCAAIVTGETPKKERERVLKDFKSGKLEVVANVGVLTTGFDYPELDTIVMARPTMSLALWYQCVGRGIRPSEGKNGWLVDMCGNVGRFGKVDDLTLTESSPGRGDWCVWGVVKNKWQQLTNIFF